MKTTREIIPTQLYRDIFPRDFYRRCKRCGSKIKIQPKYYMVREGISETGCILVKKSTIKSCSYFCADYFTYKTGKVIKDMRDEQSL